VLETFSKNLMKNTNSNIILKLFSPIMIFVSAALSSYLVSYFLDSMNYLRLNILSILLFVLGSLLVFEIFLFLFKIIFGNRIIFFEDKTKFTENDIYDNCYDNNWEKGAVITEKKSRLRKIINVKK